MKWIALAVIGILAVYTITFHNGLVSLKNQISVAHKNNQQIYSSIRIQIEQSGMVTEEYSDQVIRAIQEAMQNRYGSGGAKGAMLWIQEQNPTIDSALFIKLQQIIESSYSRFEANQTTLLDKGRIFQTKIEKFPGSLLAGLLGWSMADIEPFMTILTNSDAQRDYSTGTMTAPNTFNNKN